MGVLQKISNWFVLALLMLAADLLSASRTPVVAPGFMLMAALPLLVELLASGVRSRAGLRLLAMAVNWIATVLMASLAAAAFTGIGGTSGLFPILAVAASLYAWNAIGLCMQGVLE